MKRLWTSYLKRLEAFSFSIDIPVNITNYQSKILEFDSFFLRRGFHWDIYKIVTVSDNKPLEIDTFLENYVIDRKKSFFRNLEFPHISLLRWIDWYVYSEKLVETKEWNLVMSVPQKDETWGSTNFSLSGFHTNEVFEIWKTYSYGPSLEDLEKGGQHNVEMLIDSNANIWFEEFDITNIKEEDSPRYRSIFFDNPVDNRPIAYRVTPRFNSFWRDIKNKVIEMSGEVQIDKTAYSYGMGLVNDDGYILLDGKIIFQEDIENGNIQLPD